MDKVIIDGVDVSECSYAITPKRQCPNKPMPYAKETSCISCKEHNTKLNFCKNNPDCYYKQLKRLERQYEDVLKLAKENADSNEYCLQELEQENETLERTNNELRKRFSEDTTKLSAELQQYKDMAKKGLEEFKDVGGCWGCGIQESLNQAWADCKNYRQALQDIRKYCEEQNLKADYTACEIIDKINEVIGAE